MKGFAEDKINMTVRLNFVLEMVENIKGKGENVGTQHFFPFPYNVFKRLLVQGCLKPGFCGQELIVYRPFYQKTNL